MHIKEENLARLETELRRLNSALSEGSIGLLLEESRKLLAVDPDDLNICQTVALFLIDGGSVTLDYQALVEGIKLLEEVLDERVLLDEEDLIVFRYNLSNGYAALYQVHMKNNQVDLAEAALQTQKLHLQEILLRRERIPSEILPAVLTNYANMLDHLNRTFEAIDQYLDCLQIEPEHGVAMGNCGVALRRVLHWSEQHRLRNLQASWNLLSTAVAHPERIIEWAGPSALASIIRKSEALNEEMGRWIKGGLKGLEKFRRHRQEQHSHGQPEPWLQDVLRDRLLLTFI